MEPIKYKVGDVLHLEGSGFATIIGTYHVSIYRREYEMIMDRQIITASVESFDREARVRKVTHSKLVEVLYA